MTRPTLQNVQILRFVAAGGVLISHTADLLIPHRSFIWSVRWTSGVDIFFVISGFIMVYLTVGCFGDAAAAKSFLIRRIIRIVPPYWFFTTFMIVATLAFPGQVHHTVVTLPRLVTSYAFVPWPRADGKLNPLLSQGWTLNYEAFFYLAFTLAMLSRRGLIWLAAAFVMLVALHEWLPAQLFILRFWANPIILEFLAGIVLALLFLKGRRLAFLPALAFCLAGAALLAAPAPFNVGSFSRLLAQGLPAILLCTGFILSPHPRRPGPFRRLLIRGGDASYTLYLSHTLTINAMVLLWRRVGTGSPWLGLLISMSVAIAIAMLLYEWLERPVTVALQRATNVKPIRGAADVAP